MRNACTKTGTARRKGLSFVWSSCSDEITPSMASQPSRPRSLGFPATRVCFAHGPADTPASALATVLLAHVPSFGRFDEILHLVDGRHSPTAFKNFKAA